MYTSSIMLNGFNIYEMFSVVLQNHRELKQENIIFKYYGNKVFRRDNIT